MRFIAQYETLALIYRTPSPVEFFPAEPLAPPIHFKLHLNNNQTGSISEHLGNGLLEPGSLTSILDLLLPFIH